MSRTEELLRELADDFAGKGMGAVAAVCRSGADRIAEMEKQMQAVPTWQPANTAPADGTEFLAALRYRDGVDGGILAVRWHEPWAQWVTAGCLVGLQNNAKDDENVDLVAWMPLPNPPQD